jgi:hypothetical protein
MALSDWNEDESLGKEPCKTERDSWRCPNMKPVDGDTDMNYEHYKCSLCSKRVKLDYSEMS